MNVILHKARPNAKLLIMVILTSISSLMFLIAFSLLLKNGNALKENILLIVSLFLLWSHTYVLVIGFSLYFYFTSHATSKDLIEREKFSYLIAIFIGFLFFAPLIIYRSYYLSGGKVKTIRRAMHDYEESICEDIIDARIASGKLKLEKSVLRQIKDVKDLYKEKFITLEEKQSYLWEIQHDHGDFVGKSVDYDSPEVAYKINEIIETY